MNRIYEYRLYPRKRERQALELLLEQSREVYNAALQQSKNAYEATKAKQSAIDQWVYFREWRKQAGILLNASSLQQVLRRLDKAYSNFFRRLKAGETPGGYPRFKGATQFSSVDYTYGDGCKFDFDERRDRFFLRIQNVGDLKVKVHRFLPDTAKIKRVTLKRKVSGWYALLVLEIPDPVLAEPNGLSEVGGDMGLLRLLTLSDGNEIDNPRWLRKALTELRIAQRRLARRVKGSNRRKDARIILAKLHERVANTRRDFWHKITDWLVHNYGLIALENLTLNFMLRNDRLSLSAHDAGLGLFQNLLAYKALDAGAAVMFVNPAYTSQICSGCGEIVKKDLSVRVHSCPACRLVLDRDVNAAINILSLALQSAWIGPSDVNVDQRVMRSLRSPRIYPGE